MNPPLLEDPLYQLLLRQSRVLLLQTVSDALRYWQGQSRCPALIICNARTIQINGEKITSRVKIMSRCSFAVGVRSTTKILE